MMFKSFFVFFFQSKEFTKTDIICMQWIHVLEKARYLILLADLNLQLFFLYVDEK